MPINFNLLVSDNSLQQSLIDKATGLPLTNGVVTFYIDDGGTTLKNIYMQTGTAGTYNYVLLPNPLTLSAVGTFVDIAGNDIEIFYYPFDETAANQTNPPRQPYHVSVDSATSIHQFDRFNFPFGVGSGGGGGSGIPTLKNVLVNNEFWRNAGTVDVSANTSYVIAPSQHDGFSMPDIQFIQDVGGGGQVQSVTFNKFPDPGQTLTNDVTGEFYIDFDCTNIGAGATLSKIIQIPISLHLLTLGGLTGCKFAIQAKGVSGNQIFGASILAFPGTGGGAGTTLNLTIGGNASIPLTGSWAKYVFDTFTFPPSLPAGSLGDGGDDAFYLQIKLPAGLTGLSHIQFAKPQIYLSATIPTNDFATYDEIDTIINSPRTGDVRSSLNSFQPFGWVLCNDGVISNVSTVPLPITPPVGISIARANQDTWPLFNLLWSNTNITVVPIYDSTGALSTKGATAIADFAAGKQLLLPLTLGRALLGLPPAGSSSGYNPVNGQFTVTAAFTNLLDVDTPVLLSGAAIPGAFSATTLYRVIIDSPTLIRLATSEANAYLGASVVGGAAGVPPFTITPQIGGSFGQAQHVQLVGELAAHDHPPLTGAAFLTTTAGTSNATAAGNPWNSSGTTGVTGSSNPFNIVQPSVYLNVFLKL